jgi:hypothetical protein
MLTLSKEGEWFRGRIPGTNRQDHHLVTLLGLVMDQSATGKNGVIKVGGEVNPIHIVDFPKRTIISRTDSCLL